MSGYYLDEMVRPLGYQTYDDYLRSEWWSDTRRKFLDSEYVTRLGNSPLCSVCGRPGCWSVPLQVHHKTYQNLGNELMTDLLLVCIDCHYKIHRKLRREAFQRNVRSDILSGRVRVIYKKSHKRGRSLSRFRS